MRNKNLFFVFAAILLAGFISDANADEVTKWNTVLLNAVRVDKTAPPRASRAMALVHVSIFDAVNGTNPTRKPYHFAGTDAGASAPAAAASAAHRILSKVYPAQQATFDAELAASLGAIPDGDAKTRGITLGQNAAEDIFALRAADTGTEPIPAPAAAPGVWEPTPPAFAPYLLPSWGKVAPWTMKSSDEYRRPGPPSLNSGEYAKDFNEVKRLGAKTGSERTPEQSEIALFWADGPGTATPPGHWHMIAQGISQAKNLSLEDNARLFALLGMAGADAAIISWDMKATYYFWRPVTAIRKADTDGNKQTDADPAWESFIITPPFPDYTSGHSTFSGASAETLKCFFNDDSISFTTTSDALAGVTRSFSSFSQASDEAGRSRIYGGIHFQFANEDSLKAGRQMARQACEHLLK